jgi:hypothetical protein
MSDRAKMLAWGPAVSLMFRAAVAEWIRNRKELYRLWNEDDRRIPTTKIKQWLSKPGLSRDILAEAMTAQGFSADRRATIKAITNTFPTMQYLRICGIKGSAGCPFGTCRAPRETLEHLQCSCPANGPVAVGRLEASVRAVGRVSLSTFGGDGSYDSGPMAGLSTGRNGNLCSGVQESL